MLRCGRGSDSLSVEPSHAYHYGLTLLKYSLSTAMALEARIDHVVEQLTQCLYRICQSERKIDLAYWITCFSLDLLGEVGFSQSFGLLETGRDDQGVVRALQFGTPLMMAFSHVPLLVEAVRSRAFRLLFGQSGIRYLEQVCAVRRCVHGAIPDEHCSLPKP